MCGLQDLAGAIVDRALAAGSGTGSVGSLQASPRRPPAARSAAAATSAAAALPHTPGRHRHTRSYDDYDHLAGAGLLPGGAGECAEYCHATASSGPATATGSPAGGRARDRGGARDPGAAGEGFWPGEMDVAVAHRPYSAVQLATAPCYSHAGTPAGRVLGGLGGSPTPNQPISKLLYGLSLAQLLGWPS